MRAPSQERKKDRLELMLIWFIVGLSALLIVIMVAACSLVRSAQAEASAVSQFDQVAQATRGTGLEECISRAEDSFHDQSDIFVSNYSGHSRRTAWTTPSEVAHELLRLCARRQAGHIWGPIHREVPTPYFAARFVAEPLELPDVAPVGPGLDQCIDADIEGYIKCLLGRLDDFELHGTERYAAATAERWNVWNAKWAAPPEGDLAVLMDELRPLMDDEGMVTQMVCYCDRQTLYCACSSTRWWTSSLMSSQETPPTTGTDGTLATTSSCIQGKPSAP